MLTYCTYILTTGQETSVLLLPRNQGKGMGDGISDSVHKGHRGPLWERGATGGPEKWAGTCHPQPSPGQ